MSPEPTSAFQLTKTHFKQFLECRREFWLRHHHPEAIPEPIDAHAQYLIRQGYEVERIARSVLKQSIDPEHLLRQHTVTHKNLLARFDIFRTREDGTCAVYEVKSSKHIPSTETAKAKQEKRKLNLLDLGFQVHVARLAGLDVTEAHLVTINGDYERGAELDPRAAIHIEDVTEEINSIQAEVGKLAAAAIELIAADPGDGYEDLCVRKLKCPYFRYTQPDLPAVTIYDIPGLRGERFENLVATGVLAVTDLDGTEELTANMWDFVDKIKNPPPVEIRYDEIREMLARLEYPLYFLDYETVNPAIPQFEGMRSYEQITFQFSVHVLEDADAGLTHHEYLSDGSGEPQRELVEELRKSVGDAGTVISWNKSFEQTQNRLLARLYPDHREFLESVNERMFDLAEPFAKGLYNDPGIKGWSIKNVLPVLVPGMSYDSLDVSGGAIASALWYMDVYVGSEEKERRMVQLREYCKQDTLAMVRILEALS
ncbi:MAG: DUF2779 domain-containing protein [Acidobacteriota bacterium]|nr:DUF2779 domain-containing protein [Acidobacteriota bacterium]MDH3529365.1 DUF2779 domain-containing protein [Acidobacteriota bacterium]